MKTWLPFVPVPWVILLQQKKVQKQQKALAVSVNYCYSKTLKLEIYRMKLNRIKAVSLNLLVNHCLIIVYLDENYGTNALAF